MILFIGIIVVLFAIVYGIFLIFRYCEVIKSLTNENITLQSNVRALKSERDVLVQRVIKAERGQNDLYNTLYRQQSEINGKKK